MIVFDCAGSSMLRRLFSSCSNQRLLSSCGAQVSHCGGFSCCQARALGCMGCISCGSWALEHRLNSWGAQTQLLRGMWDFPHPGIEPVSPALTGRFFTIEEALFDASYLSLGFPGGSDGKASACNLGDPGSIPGSGRSPGEGNGNPLQHSCLENPMDRGAW